MAPNGQSSSASTGSPPPDSWALTSALQPSPRPTSLPECSRNRGLAIGFSTRASEADDLLPLIELAHRMRADYLSVQVSGSLKASPEIAEILEDMFDLVNDAGLPLFIETHRGTVAQDFAGRSR